MNSFLISLTERGLIPDWLIRFGVRNLLKQRIGELTGDTIESLCRHKQRFIECQESSPVALQTEAANEQHYEVPAEFFEQVLGIHLKYSCGYWAKNTRTLSESEDLALEKTCIFARIKNGQKILELGCGWGSLTLFMAERYPESDITAVSNSLSQAHYIRSQLESRSLTNVEVITADMNVFDAPNSHFDRVVSVEMFEHMRNYSLLYERISSWLLPGGLFFKHIFVHRSMPYLFEVRDSNDWMSKYFFSGGMMPCDDLPSRFQRHLTLVDRVVWDGQNYQKTCNTWLNNMDSNKSELFPVLQNVYGHAEAKLWWIRWRIFFMACAELFGFRGGREWWVSHYLFEKKC